MVYLELGWWGIHLSAIANGRCLFTGSVGEKLQQSTSPSSIVRSVVLAGFNHELRIQDESSVHPKLGLNCVVSSGHE